MDKLIADLDRWVAQGVISPERRDAILAEATARPAKAGSGGFSIMPFVLGTLMAAGLTVLVMGFSDPTLIPRPLAVLLLMLSLAAAMVLGHWFSGRNRTVASDLSILAALGFFGASLFFITHVYFIHVHPPDLVLIWAVAGLLGAFILPSRGALAAGITAATVWSLMEVQDYRTVFHSEYLILWIPAFAWTVALRWRTGLHFAAVGLLCWIAVNVRPGANLLGWGTLDVLGLGVIASTALWVAGRYLETRRFPFPRTLEYYGLALAMISVFLVRFFFQYQAPYPIWQMFAGFSALTVFALALSTFGRDRQTLAAVVALLIFGMAYPNVAPVLFNSLYIIQHGAFVILAVWVVTHGIKLRDSVIVALGLAGLCAEIVEFFASATGVGPGDNMLIGLGFVLGLICIAAAAIAHKTILKDGRRQNGGPS